MSWQDVERRIISLLCRIYGVSNWEPPHDYTDKERDLCEIIVDLEIRIEELERKTEVLK
jgi:hypothetical protein